MIPKKTVEEILQVTPCVSDRMMDAIQLWSDMYEGFSPWCREPTFENPTRVVSLGLPALIASEKARMATLERKTEISAPYQAVSSVKNPTNSSESQPVPFTTETNAENQPSLQNGLTSTVKSGKASEKPMNERAEFLNAQYEKLKKQLRRQVEYGIAKGGLVIKPYIRQFKKTTPEGESSTLSYNPNLPDAEIEFDFVQADRFYPLTFDANGKVLEAAFIQTKLDKARECVFIRLEYHKLENHRVIVKNYAFESSDITLANVNNIKNATNLGKSIKLTEVPEWASLQETTIIDNVDKLLFAYFRMPEANTVDPYSPLGVSGYSRVVQLIKDADMQYSRLLWEFQGGELAIDVDRDALKFVTEPNGENHSVLTELQQRLFRKVDLNAEDTYNVFAPALRDASLLRGLNAIFSRIEDATGLSRGTISEVTTAEAKTATELKIIRQRSFATNADIQQAIQAALEDTVYVMDVYATLYEVTPPGDYEVSFEWDDSIIVDSESELSKRITLMQNGLASKLETRMWYFGETENQARMALEQVRAEATQAVMDNVKAEQAQAAAAGELPKGPENTTSAKVSTGEQADNLDNPDKSKTVDQIKTE